MAFAQNPTESDYYKIARIPAPEGLVLEVGGLALCPTAMWPFPPEEGMFTLSKIPIVRVQISENSHLACMKF